MLAVEVDHDLFGKWLVVESPFALGCGFFHLIF